MKRDYDEYEYLSTLSLTLAQTVTHTCLPGSQMPITERPELNSASPPI